MSRDRPGSLEEVRDAAELLGYRLVSARRWHRRRPRLRQEKPQSPRQRSRAAYLFVGGYAALLGVVGIWPAGYALNLALTTFDGAFSGLANFTGCYNQGFLLAAFEHVGEFMLIWLTALIVMVIGLSLLMHTLAPRVSAAFRFVFYIPAAFAGSASVLLWLFLLQPGTKPLGLPAPCARLQDAGRLADLRKPADHLRADRILDRCWQLDPRDPRGTRKRSGGGPGSGVARRGRPAADRAADQAADDQEVGRLHADRRVCRGPSCSPSPS